MSIEVIKQMIAVLERFANEERVKPVEVGECDDRLYRIYSQSAKTLRRVYNIEKTEGGSITISRNDAYIAKIGIIEAVKKGGLKKFRSCDILLCFL